MARTAAFSACLGAPLRLELGPARGAAGEHRADAADGPARDRARRCCRRSAGGSRGAGVALLLAGAIALDVSRPWSIGRIAGRAGRGFLDFYDVLVPFDARRASAHARRRSPRRLPLHGARRAGGRGEATARSRASSSSRERAGRRRSCPGDDDLGRGAFAARRRARARRLAATRGAARSSSDPRRDRASSSSRSSSRARARSRRASSSSWENWDFYNKPGKPVNVEYVWSSNYDGIDFPKERTRVFTVQAPARSVYWRATTLDAFTNDHWDEDLFALYSEVQSNPVRLTDDPLLPASARDDSELDAGRRDDRRAARRAPRRAEPARPVRHAGDRRRPVRESAASRVRSGRSPRGAEYTVWGYTPQPSPARLARSPADYPPEIELRRALSAAPSTAPPCLRSATPEHADVGRARTSTTTSTGGAIGRSTRSPGGSPGKATNPYAAAVAHRGLVPLGRRVRLRRASAAGAGAARRSSSS